MGTDLENASAVDFGANAATIVSDTPTEITARSPAAPASGDPAGQVDITVTTPCGTSATSSDDDFTYVAPPSVTAVSPAAGSAAGGSQVTITGTGLAGATVVDFGALNPAVILSDTDNQGVDTLVVVSPAATSNTFAWVVVAVTTPYGISPTSANWYEYTPAPTVTGISQLYGAGGRDDGDDQRHEPRRGHGGRFRRMGATSFTINPNGSITAVSPAGAAGTVNVTVATPLGTSATSSGDQFTYAVPPTTMAGSYSATADSTMTVAAASGVLAADSDPQGLPMTAALLSNPADGTVSLANDGSFTYTPATGFLGVDSFTYQAGNGYATSGPATVWIAVGPGTLT